MIKPILFPTKAGFLSKKKCIFGPFQSRVAMQKKI